MEAVSNIVPAEQISAEKIVDILERLAIPAAIFSSNLKTIQTTRFLSDSQKEEIEHFFRTNQEYTEAEEPNEEHSFFIYPLHSNPELLTALFPQEDFSIPSNFRYKLPGVRKEIEQLLEPLLDATAIKDIYPAILNRITESVSCSTAGIVIPAAGNTFDVHLHHHNKEYSNKPEELLPIELPVILTVARSKSKIVINNNDTGINESSCNSLLEYGNFCFLPVFFRDNLIAILYIGRNNKRFDTEEMMFLEQFADYFGFANAFIITNKKNRELENKLNQKEKLETIGKMASGMAHDFSNLLSSIFGSIDLLKYKVFDPDVLKVVLSIEKAAARARDLTKDLLSYGKPTSRQKETVIPTALLNEIGESISKTFDQKKKLIVSVDEDIYDILGNSTQIYQVLLNLCVNAREAIEDEGTVLLKARNITITENDDAGFVQPPPGNYVHFSVSDNGCGIPEENLNKIFEPYFSTKQRETDSGLGLYIIYGIIKAHQGFIEVSSEVGKGTAFDVFFPAFEKKKKTEHAQKIIVLADDEEMLQDLLAELLESHDYTVVKVASGEETLTLLTEEFKGDLLIIDYNMPGLNGLDTIAEIRRRSIDIPVILSTGTNEFPDTYDFSELAIRNFLTKPYDFETLLKTVEQYL